MKGKVVISLLVLLVTGPQVFAQPTARVQAIHNAPDPELNVVDLYVADQLILDDVAFRTASAYMDVPAGFPLTGGVAPGNSTGPGDVFFEFTFTLTPGETYQFIAVGVREPGDFQPNPDGRDISLDVLVNDEAREVAENPSEIDMLAVHGVPDGPAFDIFEGPFPRSGRGGFILADDLRFLDSSGYNSTSQTLFNLQVNYSSDDSFYELFTGPDFKLGQAITVLLSGFLDPSSNQNGPEFAPIAVFSDGTTYMYEPEPTTTEPETTVQTFTLNTNYPNPFNPTTNIRFDLQEPGHVSVEVFDVLGRSMLQRNAGFFPADAGNQFQLDASSLPSGTYVYRVLVDVNGTISTQSGRMTLVK